MVRFACFMAICAMLFCALRADADVKMPAIFGDHMVVQSGIKIPVWGTADAGEKVTIKAAGQEQSTTADGKGKWRVSLDPIAASVPIEIAIAGKNSITIKDVLVGEVWLCSGQSNMGFTLKTASNGAEAIKAADHPKIRLFKIHDAYKDEPQDDLDAKWEVCSPTTVPDFSAVAYFFGADLHEATEQPVGLIQSEWGGTRAEAWLPRATFDALKLPYEPEWTQQWLHPKPDPKTGKPDKERPYEAPSAIYNAMIAPIAGYAIRGIVWYQGETNTAYPEKYKDVLSALITSWRGVWGQGEFPALIVQLPNFDSGTRDWVALRKSQAQVAQEVPSVGMIVTIDIGNPKNIHPTVKLPVGHRLSVLAQKMVYGKDVPSAGPTFRSMEVTGSSIAVSYDHVEGGLTSKGDVQGFEIAGDDGKFVPATAKIDGDKVIVTAEGVSSPKMVHYGWTNNPTCTLYNKADLPAVPFEAKTK